MSKRRECQRGLSIFEREQDGSMPEPLINNVHACTLFASMAMVYMNLFLAGAM